MKKTLFLSLIDFKLIFREPSLRIFLMMPALIFALVLFILPLLRDRYEGVESFIPIVLMGATMQTSILFGSIYSMVLIHEKDIQVAKVYGIVPVSKVGFIISRLFIPYLISALVTYLLLWMQPFYVLPPVPMLFLSLLCGLLAPLLTLSVATFSKNKMEGMTWFKLANLLVSIPFAAFFIEKYTDAFGIIPTHWMFQSLHHMINGGNYQLPLSIGFAYTLLLLVFLVKRFSKKHFE